jgi:hypothetical protein
MGLKKLAVSPPPWSWVNIDRDENKICSYRAIRIYAGSTKTLIHMWLAGSDRNGWVKIQDCILKNLYLK